MTALRILARGARHRRGAPLSLSRATQIAAALGIALCVSALTTIVLLAALEQPRGEGGGSSGGAGDGAPAIGSMTMPTPRRSVVALHRSAPAPSPPADPATATASPTRALRRTPLPGTHIALLVPARAVHGTQTVDQLALFQHLVPSLFEHMACDASGGPTGSHPGGLVHLHLYVGYDAGDPFYDNADHLTAVREYYAEMWAVFLAGSIPAPSADIVNGGPPTLVLRRFKGMHGAPCWVWNMLAVEAYNDGASHFVQFNDDIRVLSDCWGSNLVSVLDADSLHPGFGVVGPRDLGNAKLLTQALVSRTHLDIFGKLYPDAFRNWYSDDWLSQVYGEAHTTMDDRVVVVNSNAQGTRYEKNDEAGGWLADEIEKGRRRVARWLEWASSYKT